MKNTIKLVLFLALCTAVSSQMTAQRSVYWLHGLNGQADRWQGYADSFQTARQMTSFRPEFLSTGSLDQITDGVDGQFTPAPTNIGIGASLGGIVMRNLERRGNDPNEIGGIITSHSPNQGAAIATVVNNGSLEAHLNNVINTIAESLREIEEHLTIGGDGIWGAILSGVNIIFAGGNETLNLIVEAIGSGSEIPSEEVIATQIATVFNIINNPASQNIFQDIDPNNNFMSELNAFPSTLPRIEIHGYETDKEIFRMDCSQKSMVWASPLAITSPIPDDTCKVFQDLRDGEGKLQTAQDFLNIMGAWNTLSPVNWLRKKRRPTALWEAAQDVKDAKNMISHGIEEGWEALIFAAVPTTQNQLALTSQCELIINQLNEQLNVQYGELALCQMETLNCDDFADAIAATYNQIAFYRNSSSCYESVPVTVYVNDPEAKYDGLFLDAEQVTGSAFAVYANAPVLVNGKPEGVNHVEALNHPSAWINFNDIFDRGEFDFFHTPPR